MGIQTVEDPAHSNPVCAITGGSSGIGLATACLFAANGYDVAICGRSMEKLFAAKNKIVKATKSEKLGHMFFQIDLSQPKQAINFVKKVIHDAKRIDVLVNCAALAPLANLEDIDDETFESTVDVNIRSNFYLTRQAWKEMKKAGEGTIVNISSMAAVDPFPGFSLYGASKAWMELMTHALASEGSDAGIRICSIRPGAVETPLLRSLFPDFPADQCAQPEDIAKMVLGCVEDPEKYPSGKSFEVEATQSDTQREDSETQ